MIELEHVSKQFAHSVAVNDLSLTVRQGEFLVLVGGSGSGKTTTLKMINRLIEPSAGRISVAGKDVQEVPPHVLRRSIGYCFQHTGLFPHLSVAANIGITPSLLGWPPERIATRTAELLDLVELPREYGARMPHQLSGGEQQRVGVARALAAQPQVVLFDEPFGGLDPVTRDILQDSLRAIHRRVGFTAVFVTHDMIEALILSDRIAVMHQGQLLQIGSPNDLMAAPANDYVQRLLATPTRQAERLRRIMDEPGGGA